MSFSPQQPAQAASASSTPHPLSDASAAAQLLAQHSLAQQQLAALQQQVAALLQQPQPPGHRPTAPPAAGRPRLPPPNHWEGSPSKLDEWEGELTRQFDWYGMTDDGERVRYTAALLRGPAADWWTHLPVASRPTSFGALTAALRLRFQPVTAAETARAKLIQLSQAKSGSVNDYVAAFRRLLVSVPDMSEADRLFQFVRGLSRPIAALIHQQGVATLDAAITVAVRAGGYGFGSASAASPASSPMELDVIEGLDAETDGSEPITRAELLDALNAIREQRGRGGGAPAPSRASGPGRGAQRGLPRIPHLSPDEVKAYMDAGKCFGCGSTDHSSRHCPNRRIGADGRVSWKSKEGN